MSTDIEKHPQITMAPKVTVVPKAQRVVVSDSKEAKNKLLSDLESELGRMAKLIGQLKAEFSRASE